MYPVRSDVELPPAFRLTTPVENLLNLPLETVEANLDKWLAGWEEAIEK
jgi:ABC-type thiamine transport system substrate-binding protein